jgi:hypothetical protein
MADNIESRLARLEERIEGMRNATNVAKREVDRRLNEMNQLRKQIESERGRFVEREYYDQAHKNLETQVNSLDRRVSAMEGGNQIKASTIGWGLAAAGVFVTVVVVVVNLLTAGGP